MIRKELCAIVGMKVPTFATHLANGDLPFKVETSSREDVQGRTWSRFTAHNAMAMLAARHLVDAQGMSWSEAARMLREGPGQSCGLVGVGQSYFDRDGIFAAQVQYANTRTNEAPRSVPARKLFRGPLDKIVATALSIAAANKEGREEIRVVSMVSVDLSHHYQLARGLMREFGFTTEIDGAPEPTGEASE